MHSPTDYTPRQFYAVRPETIEAYLSLTNDQVVAGMYHRLCTNILTSGATARLISLLMNRVHAAYHMSCTFLVENIEKTLRQNPLMYESFLEPFEKMTRQFRVCGRESSLDLHKLMDDIDAITNQLAAFSDSTRFSRVFARSSR